MTKEEAIWWVNHLFEIRKEEYFNKGMIKDAKEVEEAQHMAIEALQAKTEGDLIRRQDAIDALSEDIMGGLNYRRILQSLPSAEPKIGEWIQKNLCADRFCSCCDYVVWDSEAEEYNYCPNCGAKMRGEKNERTAK